MTDKTFTALSGFAQVVLPGVLFTLPDFKAAMLLAGKAFGQPFLDDVWRQFCQKGGVPGEIAKAKIDVGAVEVWRFPAVSIQFPRPGQAGEAYMALFVVPPAPANSVRRYFTLEIASAQATAATALYEWAPASTPDGYQRIHHRDGVEATLPAFCTAVDQLLERTAAPMDFFGHLGLLVPRSPASAPASSDASVSNEGGTTQGPTKRRRWWQFWKYLR